MRLWSLHPGYLDTKGLLALWREGLLAKHVLEGWTNGYRNHPALKRFKQADDPVSAINSYLAEVYEESLKRGYQFDQSKIGLVKGRCMLEVTRGQLAYERRHLERKLLLRDLAAYDRLSTAKRLAHFKMFKVIAGGIADWEIPF
ncbi:hypothetical protein SAMN05192529_1226 [Arachidicoccus rhizosphaerae]|uniref:Pyrimidine dimer DNA glycosylase /DNA-(Apurinic or apyrimidinic site) lyase n=1 Tax=Arachidicoccus rhizosphaerae TaxID=551991 RepID=A0A1H4BK15_9BACT|nr:pyrimidine dimer DNA glycosylase/endonuclease V [Arachidicoccus rhizosphaerae]SEA48152.1 hypothetical protein SAMN05192529_1226 [Arachidicoccus rhizosphaerae]